MVFSDWFSRNMVCVALSAICFFASGGPSVAAAPAVGPGCDPAFMTAMQNKAWMEAQREIMIAETTIAKPDSVFALGCFGHFAGNTGTGGFSGGTAYNLSSNVNTFVSAAFSAYGGGHLQGSSSNSGDNSNCGMMAQIWNAARCLNADEGSAQLGSLKDISSYNRGAYPAACGSPGAWSGPLSTIYGAKAANKSVGAAFDDMDLFTEVTAPVSQVKNKKCAPGIPTGIKIGNANEIVCPNPGCVSNGEASPKCCDTSGQNCSD